jgi:cytochrome c556
MGNTMMKRIAFTGAVVLGSLLSLNVMAAAEQTPEQKAAADVANRQAVFKLLSFAQGGSYGAMARGTAYNAEVAKAGVERVIMLSKMIPEVFANDTSKMTGLTTRANNTIWTSKADFDKLAMDLTTTATAALATLESKGEAGVKEVVAAIGPKCGACHDVYRAK